jgi:hypothetical protein
MPHKFKIGDMVFVPPNVLRRVPAGIFEILRLLPPVDAGPQYRIKSELERCERVVLECDLKRPTSEPALRS